MTQPSSPPSPSLPLSIVAEPNPDDRLSGYALAWLGFVAYFVVVETIAIRADARHHDRVKRTLSANIRYVFATDSVTGIAVAAPHGKLRRLALITAEGWLGHHFARNGEV